MNSGKPEERGSVWVSGPVRGCSAAWSRTTGNSEPVHLCSRCQETEDERELWIFLSSHSALFLMLLSFQEPSPCLSFKANTTRNRSLISWKFRAGWQPSLKRAPVEKTWRRELPTLVSGGCILHPADWAMRSWVPFSLLSRVSSTYSSCHCCLRSCMAQSFLAHFLTHRFLISCEKNTINISTFKKRC